MAAKDAANIVSLLSVAFVCLADDGEEGPESRLASARKVSKYISNTFGVSVKDLPPTLRSSLEKIGAKPLACIHAVNPFLVCCWFSVAGFNLWTSMEK